MWRDFWPTLYYVVVVAAVTVVVTVAAVVAVPVALSGVAEMQLCVCNLCLIHSHTHSVTRASFFCTVFRSHLPILISIVCACGRKTLKKSRLICLYT